MFSFSFSSANSFLFTSIPQVCIQILPRKLWRKKSQEENFHPHNSIKIATFSEWSHSLHGDRDFLFKNLPPRICEIQCIFPASSSFLWKQFTDLGSRKSWRTNTSREFVIDFRKSVLIGSRFTFQWDNTEDDDSFSFLVVSSSSFRAVRM